MVSPQPFKIYLYGLLLLGILGTTLAHHFVFSPPAQAAPQEQLDPSAAPTPRPSS